jgi:hypothetical protein
MTMTHTDEKPSGRKVDKPNKIGCWTEWRSLKTSTNRITTSKGRHTTTTILTRLFE